MKTNNSWDNQQWNWFCTVQIWALIYASVSFGSLNAMANGSLYFDGATNNYMLFSNPFFGGGQPRNWTLEFAFKSDTNENAGLYVANHLQAEFSTSELGDSASMEIKTTIDGALVVNTPFGDFSSAPNLVSPGQWQDLAVTFGPGYPYADQYGGPGQGPSWPLLTVYLNGVSIITNQQILNNYIIDWTPNNTFANNTNINGLGIISDAFGFNFDGQYAGSITELRTWGRTLSQSEIQTKMFQPLDTTSETGLFGYWQFAEGIGNIVYDSEGSNNGVIYGASWNSDYPNEPLQPPSVIQQPVDKVFVIGTSNAFFTVGVSGSEPVFYQWLFNGTNISGATGATITIPKVRLQDMGAYSVSISNLLGTVISSNANLTIYPFLKSPFTGATVLWGQDENLSVVPSGTPPFFYQWYFNNVPIVGATNQTYGIAGIQFTNAGFYSVVVSTLFGSVTNTPAQIVVNPAGVSLGMYPGVTITGTIGYNYTIQSTPNLTNTNGWVTITNLTLQQTQQLWFDASINAFNSLNPQRFYRVVPQQ